MQILEWLDTLFCSKRYISLFIINVPHPLCMKRNSEGMGPFCNLKKLELSACYMVDNFPGITYFLERSPKLELLILRSEMVSTRRLHVS